MKVCYCFGPNWATYIPTQIFALFKNNEDAESIKVYLISDSLKPEIESEIRHICTEFGREYKYINLSSFYRQRMNSRANVDNRFTRFTLYRLAIPELINEDRLLYIDADSIVCGNISELWNVDLQGALVAGCNDPFIGADHKKSIGGTAEETYLNAGVLLFDLKAVREGGYCKDWIRMSNSRHYPAHDQDIIFLTCRPHFKVVDPKFNCSLSTSLDVEDIRIMHYAGVKDKKQWVKALPKSEIWDKWQMAYENFRISGIQTAPRIPKVIRYGWFGRGEKPEKIKHCIASWDRVSPDYQVIELNEDNCDVTQNEFVRRAYEHRKYAFVADFFRMKAMYDLGCITLDADVELLKPLDPFLHHRMFSGQEIDGKILITATMGAEAGHPIVKMILDYYNAVEFDARHMTPNTQFISDIFRMFIVKKINGKIILENDVHLYPKEFFCNYDHKNRRILKSSRSYSIHWFEGSWKK